MERRAVKSRSNRLILKLARAIGRTHITPNQISLASIAFALLVPVGLQAVHGAWGAVLALLGVQLRLLCNVLDGLVAVEGGKSSALGALYNEVPDRVSDSVILLSVGYAAGLPTLAWLCALLAALTAYVRLLGGALGLAQSFSGPMAKQHRMAVVSIMLVASMLPNEINGSLNLIGMTILALGAAVTCIMRMLDIAGKLQHRSQEDASR